MSTPKYVGGERKRVRAVSRAVRGTTYSPSHLVRKVESIRKSLGALWSIADMCEDRLDLHAERLYGVNVAVTQIEEDLGYRM